MNAEKKPFEQIFVCIESDRKIFKFTEQKKRNKSKSDLLKLRLLHTKLRLWHTHSQPTTTKNV